jgi:large subunit ribosomal protein L4
MPTVDVVDLNNQKVGELELADEVFGAEVNERCCTKRSGIIRRASAAGTHKPRRGTKWPAPARSCGSRRAPDARAWVRSAVADLAAWRHHARAATARLQLQAAAQDAAGRAALGAFGQAARRRVEGRAGIFSWRITRPNMPCARCQAGSHEKVLVVENGENRNLTLGCAIWKGVKLVPSRDVNVYHLLGHKSVLLSEAAAKKFSEALAK